MEIKGLTPGTPSSSPLSHQAKGTEVRKSISTDSGAVAGKCNWDSIARDVNIKIKLYCRKAGNALDVPQQIRIFLDKDPIAIETLNLLMQPFLRLEVSFFYTESY